MKRIALSFLLLLTVFLLCGCYINMTAMTKINADGSGFRITTYTADGASEKEELIKNYILPEGGVWKLDKYVKQNAPLHIHEVKRAFTDISRLQPDYARKGVNPANISDNRYSLKINKGLILTTYEYEEVFKDCTDGKKVREFCERWYSYSLETASVEIEKAFPRVAEREKIRRVLDERYRSYYDYFLKRFLVSGRKAFEDDNAVFKAKMAEYEKKNSAEDFADFLTGYLVSLDKGLDRKKAFEKLVEVHEKIDEILSEGSTAFNDGNYDDAFGVYGWPLFMGYSFDVSVVLPGRIIEANTKDIKSNVATWEFTNDDFLLKEHRLQAKSRKVNIGAIAVISAIIIILLLVAYRKEPKKK